ncbi:MAG: arsenical resistance protein ArsH [Gemmatimonadaceae bacterium]|nr:arsenical resistance protein ArsH [Acetobacteraceae bacterium]
MAAPDTPALDGAHFRVPDPGALTAPVSRHKPRILLLHGSLRARSYSRLLADEAERLLQAMGCDTRRFDPSGLPLPDDAPSSHPKVEELRALSLWSEGQIWSSPERHGTLTGVMKCQIDWLPLDQGGVRPTQGRTLAVMQVSGGSQSFNAVNAMRLLGRWMRMLTIPNQSSVPRAYELFDGAGRLPAGPHYERLVDVCEELVHFTWLVRDNADILVDRYSERMERAGKAATAAASISEARTG